MQMGQLKRYGLFNVTTYYPSGGMSDFVAAFESAEEAKLYAERAFICDYEIEDMYEYLSEPSPAIPTEAEYKAELDKQNAVKIEFLSDPLNDAAMKLMRQLNDQMYNLGENSSAWDYLKKK